MLALQTVVYQCPLAGRDSHWQYVSETESYFYLTKVTITVSHSVCGADADGSVSHWHMASQKCMYTIAEEDNQIYAVRVVQAAHR